MTRKKNIKNINARRLRHREKALAELKAKYPHYIFKSNLVASLMLGGIILTIWETFIYEATFIPLYIPLSIWILTGLLMTPIFKKTFNIYCFSPFTKEGIPILFHYIFNIISFGGILVFLFMWTNQFFCNKSKSVATVPIISYSHHATDIDNCGGPYVHISYKNLDKELDFPCNTPIEEYKSVYIEISKGFLGFDIITNKTLIKGQ